MICSTTDKIEVGISIPICIEEQGVRISEILVLVPWLVGSCHKFSLARLQVQPAVKTCRSTDKKIFQPIPVYISFCQAGAHPGNLVRQQWSVLEIHLR